MSTPRRRSSPSQGAGTSRPAPIRRTTPTRADRPPAPPEVTATCAQRQGVVARGAIPRDLRAANRALVLDCLRLFGPATRAELAGYTGLSRTTTGAVVAELLADGLVHEGDLVAPARRGGRPGRLLHATAGRPSDPRPATVDRCVIIAVISLEGALRAWRWCEVSCDGGRAEVAEVIALAVRDALRQPDAEGTSLGQGPDRCRSAPMPSAACASETQEASATTSYPRVVANDPGWHCQLPATYDVRW